MDKAIEPTIVLLILSLITEKISNVFKLQIPILADKQEAKEEKIREKRIQLLTISVGIFVALIAKANLFLLFSNDFNLFWTDIPSDENILSDIIGSIVTGLFLSLGSKFFHDLLDILLQAKNLKQKINKRADWNFNSIDEVDNYLKEDEGKKIQTAIIPIREKLMNIENVVSVSSIYENSKPLIQVHVNSQFNQSSLVPKKFFYTGSNNSSKEIDIVIIPDHDAETHSSIFPSDTIANTNPYKDNAGSVGGSLFDAISGEQYFVSCYHVVKSPSHSWDNFQPDGNETISSNGADCGEIYKAIRDTEIDIAIMKAINGYQINSGISGIGVPYFTRNLNVNDKIYNTKVKMNGMSSGLSIGQVIDIKLPVKLKYYKENSIQIELHQLNDIIFVKALSNETFSLPGDSGSFVIDEYNYLIGVLVGGFNNVSYVIPIETILNKTNTKITKL